MDVAPNEWPVWATDEFRDWFSNLSEAAAIAVDAKIQLLAEVGPALGRPHADTLHGTNYANLKELRIAHAGHAYRVIFAFDPRRAVILLLGGSKTGKRWYATAIPAAEKLYRAYLDRLKKEQT